MPAQISIDNLALSHLGVAPISAVDENSRANNALMLVRDIARRATLGGFNWPDATVPNEVASLLTDYTPPTNWAYAYAYPAKALSVFKVYNPALLTTQALLADPILFPSSPPIQTLQKYLRYGMPFRTVYDPVNNRKVILSNCQDAVIEYTYDVDDVSIFDDTFGMALSFQEAALCAMNLTGDEAVALKMTQAFNGYISETKRLAKDEDNTEKFGSGSIEESR